MTVLHLALCGLGLICGIILYTRLPTLGRIARRTPPRQEADARYVSVIIPARNEARNLKRLISDLKAQTYTNLEIICVNDESTDETGSIIKEAACIGLDISEKPEGWLGKNYACHKGAKLAGGELLLFLDADVRLLPDGIEKLMVLYRRTGRVITIQPYHEMKKWREQLSMFFNLILVGATAKQFRGKKKTSGLYGPLILIPADEYRAIGGHESVKGDILDDLSLGGRLDQMRIPYTRLIGDQSIRFRMYADGKGMFEGWTKNFAAGASRVPAMLLLLIILWIGALLRVPMQLGLYHASMNIALLLAFVALYAFAATQIYLAARQIGSFAFLSALLYPIPLAYFVGVFLVSCIKKLLKLPVRWKGREIGQGAE